MMKNPRKLNDKKMSFDCSRKFILFTWVLNKTLGNATANVNAIMINYLSNLSNLLGYSQRLKPKRTFNQSKAFAHSR